MRLTIDEEGARSNSRPAAIALALFTMRCMEQWKHEVEDYDRAMILVAVVAISSEKLMRAELQPMERNLEQPIETEKLARCNVSSIASATGINRETTRRKVDSLVRRGLLQRASDGTIGFPAGILQKATTLALVRRQIDPVVRLANELIRLGVIKPA